MVKMTTGLEELVLELHQRGVKLSLDGDRLRSKAPKGALTPALRQQIRERKAELIAFLRQGRAVRAPLIQPIARQRDIRLSFTQHRLWVLSQFDLNTFAYNMPWPFRMTGSLNVAALEQSLSEIVQRHEVLRTIFKSTNGQPVQVITPASQIKLNVIDVTSSPNPEAEMQRLINQEMMRPFSLESDLMLRATLLRLGFDTHLLLITFHHIAFDGWSMEIFWRELKVLYAAAVAGEPSLLPPLPIQYADVAIWQRQWLQGEVFAEQLAYWKKQLHNLPVLQLPTDRPRPPVQTFRGAGYSFKLSQALCDDIAALSRQEDVTLFMSFLAAFKVLLARYTGQDDIVVGSLIANRNRTEMEHLIGFFVNTLVLRTDLSGNPTFRDTLARVREMTLGAYQHQDMPFEKLVEELSPARDLSQNPLVQVLFAVQNAPQSPYSLQGLSVTVPHLEAQTVRFDLEFHLWPLKSEEGFVGQIFYNTDLFDPGTIERMAGHFQTLLSGLVANPDKPISEQPILTEAERHQLLVEWNDTATDYPREKCIHQLFEEQVQRTPDAIAVIFGEEQLTYRTLNERANQLAHHLIELGVGPEVKVGICVERSIEMVVGLLGILKAGGAYVPLDPSYPKERLAFMLPDSEVRVLLTQSHLQNRVEASELPTIVIEQSTVTFTANPKVDVSAENLAYICYTSGSTGQPKGVQISHRSVMRLVKSTNYASFTPDEIFLQLAPLSFDASTFEIWGALLNGAQLVIMPPTPPSLAELAAAIKHYRVSTLWLTAGLFHLMVDQHLEALLGVPQLLAGGDVLSVSHVQKLLSDYSGTLINGYGPTENTTFTCCYPMNKTTQLGLSVPIGRPIANTQVYILDDCHNPVPIGVPGTLYIGGDGLARGYLNQPGLTEERFVPNPFQIGSRLYNSGDRARYLPDGNIEFLGRIDNQVKIRGFRIELGEIEAVLTQHPQVREAVVIVRTDQDDKRVVAYIIIEDGFVAQKPIVGKTLRTYLGQKLPDYMIPSAFVQLEAIPVTPNGKIDRRALPAPTWQSQTTYVAPQNEVERQIAALWQEVLSIEKAGSEQFNIGVHDNFFELGGHSLLMIQLHNRLREIYEQEDGSNPAGHAVSIAITDLFKYPTVHTFARHLSRQLYTQPALSVEQTAISAQKSLEPMASQKPGFSTEVAIIGISCRFPDANGADAFWENLRQGKESISFFSDEELLASGVEPSLLSDPNYVKAGTVLPDIKLLDAAFFGFSPREAETLDPQQRLFLECAWEAIESAGYSQEQAANPAGHAIGVYAGISMNSYLRHNLYPNRDLVESVGGYQLMLNSDKDFLPTRVSYKLNLTGPSVNVQTACSTSLVAVHLACQSLLNGECDIALAGGASVQVPQKRGYLYQAGMILSPDGHCRAFDAQAQGTVGGQGVGIVVLKRLTSAIEDGDTIHAVIKGSAINNDGALKVSYTAPSVEGQAKVIRDAQAAAGVAPETITYIEAHGTGTLLGDPIEIAALTQAFQEKSQRDGGNNPQSEACADEGSIRNPQSAIRNSPWCAIGSVKSNIGHTDTAAGVAGLIKTVLALKHQQIPPSLHFETPNPKIDFANSPFYVNTELSDWKTDGSPRRAGVSSFGIGGTNAHVVLEEAPPREPSGDSRPWQLLLLSAKTPSALDTATTNLAEYLTTSHQNLADVAYTLAKGRRRFPYRRILVCQSVDEAISSLSERERLLTGFHQSKERPIAFMFPGQGTQYVNMGRELYEVELTFREAVDNCVEILKPILGLDLRDLLMASQERALEVSHQLEQTAITQPALFVIEYALAQLWLSWGVTPQAMIGHSIGEYVAATLSGIFSLPDALKLVAVRGQLMQSLPKGAMLAVSALTPNPSPNTGRRGSGDRPLSDLPGVPLTPLPILGDAAAELSLAAINGPSLCVVSGPVDAIEAYQKQLTNQQIACRRLHTSHAFHSAMMEPILAAFTEQVQAINLRPPQIPVISNVTGTWLTAEEATNPTYWAKHLRQTVQFASGLGELLKEPELILLEVGPGRTLSTLAKAQPERTEQLVLNSLPHPRAALTPNPSPNNGRGAAEQSEMAYLLTTLGQLWLAGGAIDWDGFYAHERRHRLPLPTYPFERQPYWIEPPQGVKGDVIQSQMVPSGVSKKQEVADWFYRPSWERSPLPMSPQSESSGLGSAAASPSTPLSLGRGVRGAPGRSDKGRSVLLFVDECGLGEQLAKRLKKEGQDVITVKVGSELTKLDDQTYLLNPERRNEYDALLQDILRQGKRLSMIVHLWRVTRLVPRDEGATSRSTLVPELVEGWQAVLKLVRRRAASRRSVKTEPEQALTLHATEAGLKLGFYSLLFLAQALGSNPAGHAASEQIQLMVVTNNMQEVTGEEELCPEKATILGPVKVIPQEYPNISTSSIDVVVGNQGNQVSADSIVVNQLLAELNYSLYGLKSDHTRNGGARCRGSPSSQVTAYRGRYRWEQTFKPIRLHKTEPTKSLIREKGVYFITGGLGGIGLVLAEELARKNAKLILIGRSAFPEREAWAQWLATHDENDQISRKIRKVQALEELGAQVLVISADVANQKQMEAVMNQAKKTFGQLNGVIHAAGAVKESFRPIQEISPTECQNQFRPKVDGLLVLEQVLQGQTLDFCILLSSLSSVLGGLGFVAYSAANLFMDTFTHQHNRESATRWLSVNWDGWQLQDTSNALSSSFGASLAKLAMTPEEGVKAFKLLTLFEDNQEDDQVIVSTGELQARISKWINFEVDDQPDTEPVVKSLSSHARPMLQNAYVAPRNETEQMLADIYQTLLGIERVGINDDFFELGGHSLLATQLIFRLQTLFQVTLPLQKFFEGPTVSGLAEALAELWGGREIVEEIAQTWQEVAQLSEEETKKVIQQS